MFFHNSLMLHYQVILRKQLTQMEPWLVFQFINTLSMEFRYSYILNQYIGKTHLISSGKIDIWGCGDWTNNWSLWFTANVLWEVEFTQTPLITYPWYGSLKYTISAVNKGFISVRCPLKLKQFTISKLGHHLFRQWLVAGSAPIHYLNQSWLNFFKSWSKLKQFH